MFYLGFQARLFEKKLILCEMKEEKYLEEKKEGSVAGENVNDVVWSCENEIQKRKNALKMKFNDVETVEV